MYLDPPLLAGQYTGKLDDGGEQVQVFNILGTSLIEFTYDNLAPWPGARRVRRM